MTKEKRVVYYDYLRIFATFFVVVLHVSAKNWYTTDVNTLEWQVLNFYDGIARWTVPIFVMISGALFLRENIDVKVIYSKYILRILVAYIFWSFIYALINNPKAGLKNLIVETIHSYYHLWFLVMIIGLYVMIPILKRIMESKYLTQYFLLLSLIFAYLIPQLIEILSEIPIAKIALFTTLIKDFFNDMNIHLVIGYSSYFVMGYYLSSIDIEKKRRIQIYILGLLGFCATVIISALISIKKQEPFGGFYGNFTINVLLESIAVFVFAKYNAQKIRIINERCLARLAQYSFGAFLIHALLIEKLQDVFNLHSLSFNPIISIPVISLSVFLISFFISWLINKIPLVGKYIV